jgi:LAS superfamily LD-carboxypeptidase LdcB
LLIQHRKNYFNIKSKSLPLVNKKKIKRETINPEFRTRNLESEWYLKSGTSESESIPNNFQISGISENNLTTKLVRSAFKLWGG